MSLASPRFALTERLRQALAADVVASYAIGIDADRPRVCNPAISGAEPAGKQWYLRAIEGTPVAGLYDAVRPEPAQRNRILKMPSFGHVLAQWPSRRLRKSLGIARPEAHRYEDLESWAARWRPLGIYEHRQTRVLLCERSSLLAYVAVLQVQETTASQHYRLRRLVPALRRRLVVERQLACAPVERLALEAALDHISRAAFLTTARGQILHANTSGRVRLDRALAVRLRDAVAGRDRGFELTRIADASSVWWLAIERAPQTGEARARAAAARWALTAHQTSVLVLLARGLANKTIAAELGCAESTIEFHVTRMLAAAHVESRAALIAAIWSCG